MGQMRNQDVPGEQNQILPVQSLHGQERADFIRKKKTKKSK